MKSTIVATQVNAAPERVWSVITDLDTWVETVDAITKIERLEGDGFGVGTRWRETRVMMGKEATEVMWVTAIDPGRSYTVGAASCGMEYTSHVRVHAVGDGARLEYEMAGRPVAFFAKLTGWFFLLLMRGMMRKCLAKDLANIKATAESAAAEHQGVP